MFAYVAAGSTVVLKNEKKHISTVIKSLLLSSETVGGTGLKSHHEIFLQHEVDFSYAPHHYIVCTGPSLQNEYT